MTVESSSGRGITIPRRRLRGGALVFQRVERFVRRHPSLSPQQAAELSRIAKQFIETPNSDREARRRLRRELNQKMNQLDTMS